MFSITIKDCDIQTFRCGKNGGQRGDKKDTGVRIVHTASGAVGESREQRSQLQNKKVAFGRMAKTATFKTWVRLMASGVGYEIEKAVDQQMKQIEIEYGSFD